MPQRRNMPTIEPTAEIKMQVVTWYLSTEIPIQRQPRKAAPSRRTIVIVLSKPDAPRD